MKEFVFNCPICGVVVPGMPSVFALPPASVLLLPKAEQATRCSMTEDDCVVDGQIFLVKGSIELPVHGADEPFRWGVWAAVSEDTFAICRQHRKTPISSNKPKPGWLNSALRPYPITLNMRLGIQLRDGRTPFIGLERTDHPLALEQMNGISRERVIELYGSVAHLAAYGSPCSLVKGWRQ